MRALMLSLSKFVVKLSFKVLVQFCLWLYRMYGEALYCMQDARRLKPKPRLHPWSNRSNNPTPQLSSSHHHEKNNEKNNVEEWGHFIDTETMQVVSIEIE